jgi:hypothetical protein
VTATELKIPQAKVKQVAAAPKAISVFSPLKYPAPEKITNFQPLFSEMIEPPHPLRTNYTHVEVDKVNRFIQYS